MSQSTSAAPSPVNNGLTLIDALAGLLSFRRAPNAPYPSAVNGATSVKASAPTRAIASSDTPDVWQLYKASLSSDSVNPAAVALLKRC